MPITPPRKQAIKIHAAAFGEWPPFWSEFLADGSMLYSDENSFGPVQHDVTHAVEKITHHDAEAQAQRSRQEDVAVLDPEGLLAGEQSDDDVDADDGGCVYESALGGPGSCSDSGLTSEHTCCYPQKGLVSRGLGRADAHGAHLCRSWRS